MTDKIVEDCFGRKFIVCRKDSPDHEWEVLTQDLEMPSLGFIILLDTVDDCDTEDEAIAAWQASCEQTKKAENPSEDEDPHSPFFGLTAEEKDRLMEAIQKQDRPRSKIKGRSLPSRKDKHD